MTVKNIMLHGGPHDGRLMLEPEGCRLLFPFVVSQPNVYWADEDTPLRLRRCDCIAYEPVVYRTAGTIYKRWEYVVPTDPALREAVERFMARRAAEEQTDADYQRWMAAKQRKAEGKLPDMSWINQDVGCMGPTVPKFATYAEVEAATGTTPTPEQCVGKTMNEVRALWGMPPRTDIDGDAVDMYGKRIMPLPPQGGLVYPKQTSVDADYWLGKKPFPRHEQQNGEAMVALLDGVIAAKRRMLGSLDYLVARMGDLSFDSPPDEPVIAAKRANEPFKNDPSWVQSILNVEVVHLPDIIMKSLLEEPPPDEPIIR